MVKLPKNFIFILPLALLFAGDVSAACVTVVGATSQPIFVGKAVNAGTLDIIEGEESLLLTFNLAPNWSFSGAEGEVSAWIGTSPNLVPVDKKDLPNFKNFPHKPDNIKNPPRYQITIPLASLGCEAQIYSVLAHASLTHLDANGKALSKQNGWAGNLQSTSGDYKYFVIELIPTPLKPLVLPTIVLPPENPAITRPASPS